MTTLQQFCASVTRLGLNNSQGSQIPLKYAYFPTQVNTNSGNMPIFTRATLCYRGYYSYGPVSVCLSQVGVLLKRMDELGLFWHRSFFRHILHCDVRKLGYLQKQGYFPL